MVVFQIKSHGVFLIFWSSFVFVSVDTQLHPPVASPLGTSLSMCHRITCVLILQQIITLSSQIAPSRRHFYGSKVRPPLVELPQGTVKSDC